MGDDDAGHPDMLRFLEVGKALTVQEQWDRCEEWYRFLEAERGNPESHYAAQNDEWDAFGQDWIERGKQLQHTAGPPLATLFWLVKEGFSPPPELLLILLDCWEVYIGNAGSMSMEEAFIGVPKRGAGNYANRKSSIRRKISLAGRFSQLLREGKSNQQAAEELSNEMGGKPDADSILRSLRKFPFIRHIRSNKP